MTEFYHPGLRRVVFNTEHLILAKADLKAKRKREKRLRDLDRQKEKTDTNTTAEKK